MSLLKYIDQYWHELSKELEFMSAFRLANEKRSFLKSIGFELSLAFLKNPFKKEYQLPHLPYLHVDFLNMEFLSAIGVYTSFSLECAASIANQVYPLILEALSEPERCLAWKIFYTLVQKHYFGNVLRNVYIPETGYVTKAQLIYQGNSNLANLLNLKVISTFYSNFHSLFIEQFGANVTFSSKNVLHALKIISQRAHANSFIETLSGEALLQLIELLYERKFYYIFSKLNRFYL